MRNKARLIAKGYNQEENIDFDKTYVTRLEAIRLLHIFAYFMNFKLYQINIKSIFLNDFILKKVYTKQPPSLKNHALPNHIFKLHKVLYGLKLAPCAWYKILNNFLLENTEFSFFTMITHERLA